MQAALEVALREHHPSIRIASTPVAVDAATSTWVWFVRIEGAGLPEGWTGEQVLRIFELQAAASALRETLLSDRLIAASYPVAATLWRGELAGANAAVLQRRLPGRSAADVMAGRHSRRIVHGMADLQARLHGLSIVDAPVAHHSASEYLERDLARRRAVVRAIDPRHTWEWLQRTAATMDGQTTAEDIVLCHGDFHPLNALVDDDGSISIIDWTDACVADRHHDVGRTTALYWYASLVAASRVERAALHTVRGWLVRTHVNQYESVCGTRLQPHRLAWWQVVHLYRSWLQLNELAEGTRPDRESSTSARFPVEFRDRLLDRCHELGRHVLE